MTTVRTLTVVMLLLVTVVTVEAQSFTWPCSLDIPQVPKGTMLSFGPTMFWLLTQSPYASGMANALAQGLGAWNTTNAAGRITTYALTPTASDCPLGGVRQIGFLSFKANKATCPALWQTDVNALAMSDSYNSWPPGTPCVWPSGSCGTRSILINADYAEQWSDNGTGYDMAGMFAHEFGHMFGAGHAIIRACMRAGEPSPSCAAAPYKNTMATQIFKGDMCQRTIEQWDREQMNLINPTKVGEGEGGDPPPCGRTC